MWWFGLVTPTYFFFYLFFSSFLKKKIKYMMGSFWKKINKSEWLNYNNLNVLGGGLSVIFKTLEIKMQMCGVRSGPLPPLEECNFPLKL
jgi:hypothetical protein